MSPVLIAAIVAVVLIGVIVGSELFREVMTSRNALTREQRAREDAARDLLAGNAERDYYIDIVASVFDPIGLFHGS